MAKQTPSPAEVRAELERVLASAGFRGAGRLGPFLRFLVESTLGGESGSLKESVLGVEVFGRPADYDPRTDPIVRVEARRLRGRLEEYYGGEGKGNTVRIHLPKGGYVPEWETAALGAGAPERKLWAGRWAAILALGLVAAVGLGSFWLARRPAEWTAGETVSVAVLPFRELGSGPGNGYFAEGLTEELIGRLARLPELRVLPRASAGKGAAAVFIEGSVRRAGDRLRITARLVNAVESVTLWSETYDRPASDIFAIQDEIASSVASALRVRVRTPPAPVPSRYTTNLEAYQSYLRARQQANRYSAEGLEQAAFHYREALRHQPDYAPALAGLSQTYALALYYGGLPPGISEQEPRRLAERAIALDPALAEAHAVMGMVLGMGEQRWKEAEASARRAIELDPGSPLAHGLFAAAVLMPQGRFPEALAAFRRSLDIDPQISFVNFTYAFCLLASGDTTAAIEQYRRTLSLQNVHPDMEWDYGMALGLAGRHAEAAEAFGRARRLRGQAPGRPFGMEAYFSGDPAQARRDAPEVDAAARAGRTSAMEAARLWAVLGEKAKAFDWLEQAQRAREAQAVWLTVDPRLRALRGEPRMTALARNLGL